MRRVSITKSSVLTTLGFFLLFGTLAQNAPKYTPLEVGDQVPDYILVNLMNYPEETANLRDFRGKLLILDFWSTSCVSCVKAWPKLTELQSQFNDQIQILLINPWEDTARISAFTKRRKKFTGLDFTLPTVAKDSVILKLFPVSGVPHVVWIDAQGVIDFITFGDVLNAKNIKALLDGDEVSMPGKINNNELVRPDFSQPLFINENGGHAEEVLWQSLFAKADVKMQPAIGISANDKKGYFVVCSKASVRDLYRLAYSQRVDYHGWLVRIPISRIILEMENPHGYLEKINDEIQFQNYFTYHLVSSVPATKRELQEMMRKDLDRYIGLKPSWEERVMTCLVLEASDTTRISYEKGDKRGVVDAYEFDLNKVDVPYLLDRLESSTGYYWSQYPIVDETGYRGLLGDITLKGNLEEHRVLDQELRQYGMRFTLQERTIKVLVLREPAGFIFPYE